MYGSWEGVVYVCNRAATHLLSFKCEGFSERKELEENFRRCSRCSWGRFGGWAMFFGFDS
eukprot:snap_masked-scaffold_73-processed-gene-0.28-mRNA-1 protein AED:1.00 eAED:1.00 QI:0/0/0/0/1/1/2/0/59